MSLIHLFRRSTSNSTFDPHTEPHYDFTPGQLSFAVIWAICAFLWLLHQQKDKKSPNTAESKLLNGDAKQSCTDIKSTTPLDNDVEKDSDGKINGKDSFETKETTVIELSDKPKQGDQRNRNFSTVKPPPTFDEFLRCVAIFGLLMFYFYLCDYRKIFPKLERVYNRDEFLFLVFLLFLVACSFTIKPTTDKILNRDQTEEWKGWMQVMFVWYHVFAAKEWYNWIRVYIAAYVWMTGFGNFSFFWVRKDFSPWRFLKMQFRLNFLVTCICVGTSNEYMLYYICAMHSYWFVSVYVFMGVLKSWNTDSKKMLLKFATYLVVNCLIFEIPVVARTIFKPFGFLLNYMDPRFEPIHEWVFRATLDHWACFFGMICAYNYPHFEAFIIRLEKAEFKKQTAVKGVLITACSTVLIVWYKLFMTLDKFQYNTYHPYTSVIPILCFIVLRNLFPVLRKHYIGTFAWLGKITLETYLSQLHIYLQSNAKHFIGYLPDYHFLNFALATIIYLPISYFLFNLTTDFSAYLLPNNLKVILKNALLIGVAFLVPYIAFSIYLHWVS